MHARWFPGCQLLVLLIALLTPSKAIIAQTSPTAREVANYRGLLQAAQRNDPRQAEKLLAAGSNCNVRDDHGRTPVHVATHAAAYAAFEALSRGGCDVRALDRQQYDAITIAAVANDVRMLKLAIRLGGDPKAITSPYEGTALIAAAHLGHVEVVKTLIEAGAPLDHINNLGWTALIEAVVLGNGEKAHVNTVRVLVAGGADLSIRDRNGMTPLQLADQRGFLEISRLLKP